MKDYREIYKQHYGIDFGTEYDIHHMDFDRSNNDISNLLLLPKKLHAKYHLIINALSITVDKPKSDGFINTRINATETSYQLTMLEKLPEVLNECKKWLDLKRCGYRATDYCFIFGGK